MPHQVRHDEEKSGRMKAWPVIVLTVIVLIGLGWIMLQSGMFMHGD